MSNTNTSVPDRQLLRNVQNFSLVVGGPLYQLLRRAHLTDDALLMVRRRIIAAVLVAWLPLLVLAALEGHLFGDRSTVPFFPDLETHIRFLVVVPLLLIAELVVHQRLSPIARAFLDRNLIPPGEMQTFDAALTSAIRLRNSKVVELLLLATVYLVGILIIWRRHLAFPEAWYLAPSHKGLELSLTGLWYACVSLPLFQFLLLCWYFRLFIWARFLWQVSRIDLTLVPSHPDRLGGLGHLANTVYAFMFLLVAQGAMVAAQIADRILFFGAKLPEFNVEIATILIFLLCVVFGPLMVFSPQLARAKRRGLLDYGAFAERYVREFDVKWLRGGTAAKEQLLGSSDIQSLADMGNSFAVVQSMRLMPISRDAVLQLTAAVLLPIAPLLFTTMPLEELLQKLVGVVF